MPTTHAGALLRKYDQFWCCAPGWPDVSIEITSPIAPDSSSSLALAKDGCVVEIAPHERGTPASLQTPTTRSGLRKRVTHRLVGDNCLCPVFDGEAHKLGAALGVRGDRHDVELLLLQHLGPVGIQGRRAVSITECLETLLVAVASGYEIDLQPVLDRLGIGGRSALWQVLLIEMELPVNV